MSLFGSSPKATAPTVASGVDIQSSCYGGVVPVIYGRTRLTGNLLWYGDFQAIPVKSSSGGGGKGGEQNSGSSSYDYKASFLFALGEGPLVDVQNVWASKSMTAFADSHLSFADGGLSQAPWGYLTTKYPAQALAYAGTGYVAASAYDLGSSSQLPNLGYEVTGLFSGAIGSLPDADPKDVVTDILTNARYGVGFPSARLGSLAVFSSYCRATGMVISPVFDTQQDAASALQQIVQDCNCEFVWSGKSLTIVPYGDQTITANGATYTAPSAPLYSLSDDDFLDSGTGDPVQCSRKRPSDAWNSIKLEWLNRANQYNAEIVESKDQAAIEAYGLRGDQSSASHQFCDLSAATMAATLKLQRQTVRNVYSFTLGWRYCLLDPMDIVEISDPGLGLTNQWVRILSLEENDNGDIAVTAEEYLDGTGAAPLYSYAAGAPYAADFNVAPGLANPPLIFEPPPAMLASNSIIAPQIMIGASGGAYWGGCDVWLSLDGSTYKRMGRIAAPARQGTLTNTLAAGTDPDTGNTLSVDLGESRGSLLSGLQADADAFRTLCYVDGELIAYETATLTGPYEYGLTYLRRGVYGTTIAPHAAGSAFCRLDDSVVSFDLPVSPVSYVGQTLYLKFPSFNIYGGGQQQLADVSPYIYNPNGAAIFVYPPSGVSFTVGAEQQADGTWLSYGVVAWTASQDPLFDQYEVQYRLHDGPGPWISWRGGASTTSFRISPLPANTAYDVQVRAVRTSGPFYSAWAQNLNVTTVGKTTAPPAPTGPSATGGYRQITLDWVASAENDIAWYEIWESADTVLAHGSRIGLITGTHYVRPGLNLADTRYYWIRAQDTSGNFSTYLGPVGATTLGVDSADITGQIVGAQIAANTLAASNLISGLDVVQVVASIGAANPATSNVAYESSTATLYRWNGSAWISSIGAGDIPAGSIDITKFASGITTVQVVSTLPGTASEGQTALLTTDGQLYRYHSGAWTVAVPAVNVTGTLNDAQIAALSASKITGTLSDSQIAALSATKITGTLSGSQIAALSAAKLTGQITTTQITPGAVTTPLLAAAAVTTANLAAGAITASKLAIGSSLIVDQYFSDASYWGLFGGAYYEGNDATSSDMGGNNAVTIPLSVIPASSSLNVGFQTASHVQVQPNTEYRLSCLAWAFAGAPPNKVLIMQAPCYAADGTTLLSDPSVTATNTLPWSATGGAPLELVFTTPAGAAFINPAVYVNGGGSGAAAGSGYWVTAALTLQPTASATLIQDGAISTNKIAANAVTAAQIAAGTITAAQIAAGTITAAQIAAGTITATQIATNTITASNIAANTITAAQIAAGAITATQLAAQAVTASKVYIGDTTNLIIDPGFTDPSYWSLLGGSSIVYYQTSAGGNYVNQPKYVVIAEPSISSTGNYGVSTPQIPVTANETYNLSVSACSVAGPPTFDLYIQASYYDVSGAYISAVNTTIHGTNALQTASLNFTPPTNAVSVLCIAFVGASGAGSGYWCVGNMKLIRRLIGSLIVDGTITATQIAAGAITASQIAGGTITAAQIQAGGITGTNIAGGTITGANIAGLTITAANLAAGTITGDKINANVFTGTSFQSVPVTGGSYNIIHGQDDGNGYGPYFGVFDGTRYRVLMGRLSNGSGGSDYGMLVTDASGNVIMSATGLGVNIVGTGNIKANNVTYPYGVNMTAGNFVLWSHSADVAGTLSFSAYVGVYHAGGAMGSPAGRLKLYINGTAIIWSDAPATFTTGVGIALGYSVAVNAGDNILIRWEETNASTTDTSGGSLFAVILQR